MKILQVIGTLAPSYGGPAVGTPELCAALAERGHHVDLFATHRGRPEEATLPSGPSVEENGFSTSYFAAHRLDAYGISWHLARALLARIPEFDVVHLHSVYSFHTAVASAVCRRRGIPYVLSSHGALDSYHWARKRWKKAPYERLIERRNLNGAYAVHVTSGSEKAGVERLALRTRVREIPLAVRGPGPASIVQRGPDETPIVLFLGRLARVKRLDVLLDAFEIVLARSPSARLVIAGPEEGGLGGDLRARARALGVSGSVEFLGPVYGEQKWRLLGRATVLVLTSDVESFGLVAVEAMAASVPVIVSRGVAIHSSISGAGAGLVVQPDPPSVAGAILGIIDYPERGRSLGERGAQLAARRFSWESVAPSYEELLEEAAQSGHRAVPGY